MTSEPGILWGIFRRRSRSREQPAVGRFERRLEGIRRFGRKGRDAFGGEPCDGGVQRALGSSHLSLSNVELARLGGHGVLRCRNSGVGSAQIGAGIADGARGGLSCSLLLLRALSNRPKDLTIDSGSYLMLRDPLKR